MLLFYPKAHLETLLEVCWYFTAEITTELFDSLCFTLASKGIVLLTKHLCHPQIHVLKPYPQCDGVRGAPLEDDQVMTVESSRFQDWDLSPFKRHPKEFLAPLPCEDTARRRLFRNQEVDLQQTL